MAQRATLGFAHQQTLGLAQCDKAFWTLGDRPLGLPSLSFRRRWQHGDQATHRSASIDPRRFGWI